MKVGELPLIGMAVGVLNSRTELLAIGVSPLGLGFRVQQQVHLLEPLRLVELLFLSFIQVVLQTYSGLVYPPAELVHSDIPRRGVVPILLLLNLWDYLLVLLDLTRDHRGGSVVFGDHG